MRIIVLASSYPRFKGDGTAPFVKSISEALADLGNEVQVLAPYDILLQDDLESTVPVHRFKYVWPKSFHIMGHARTLQADVKLHPLTPLLLPLFLFAEIINLIRLSRKMDAQVIHAHWVLPNGFAAAIASKILRIPLIITLHGSDIFMADKNFLFRSVAKWTFKQSSAVTACSQELYDRAKRIHENINIHLIPWGADPDVFKPIKQREEVRASFGWSSDEIIISTLGRMVYKKGFSHLIDIVPELISKERKIKVVIGGSGPLEDELKEKVYQMGISEIVSLPGRIPWDEVPKFLAASDIFVLPSQRDKAGNLDGLPTVLLEAMACGLPCVASDIGGVSLVISQGKNGFIFKATDYKQMESDLKTLIQEKNIRKRLGIKAREDVVKKFNCINVGKSIEYLYKISLSKNIKLRFGQQYRLIYLQQLNKNFSGKRVLDIGCYNPEWLNLIFAHEKAGIDLEPEISFPDLLLTKADGFFLPFSKDYFDVIFMLDVIEHIENDSKFICEARRVLKPGGKLVLTTPSKDIKVSPSFLTGWISQKWGHYFRRGYSPEELENLFAGFTTINIERWKAKYFLKYYFPLRFLFTISPSFIKRILTKVVKREMKQPFGSHGFLVLTATK
jgi:glycosyltransferase involved in cell wall biosynthesis